MISARVIADSISRSGKRITTMELIYPRFIHSELMTHRALSRNAASTRAIPTSKFLQRVVDDPTMPIFWGMNKPGMQADDELIPEKKAKAMEIWLKVRDFNVAAAQELAALGLHKQLTNRLVEVWQNMVTLVTATEWKNFYFQRCHEAAQPEIQTLAKVMAIAHEASIPTTIYTNQWHLPFMSAQDIEIYNTETLKRCSAARCARVSYLNHDGSSPSVEKDLELFGKLVNREDPSVPAHWSPLEHIATPDGYDKWPSGNFIGWKQFRKEFHNENFKA